MPLEKADTIDIVIAPAPGKLGLIITDAGVTTDPEARYYRLLAKLNTYGSYVISADFKRQHPTIGLVDIEIRVVCANEPTEQMRQIDGIVPRDGQQIKIPVTFAIFSGK